MPNPMKTLLPLAAGLVLGTWFAKRPVPPQARTLCPPAGQAGIRRQMEQLKREYEKQDRMRRDFTANVSHELKTPLTSISGYAEIIREGMVKSEDVGRFAGKIYEEAQRLITLVEDILNLSHLDEGAPGQERRQGIDLYALCERAVASLAEAARQRGIAISLTGSRQRVDGAEKLLAEIILTSVTTPSNTTRRMAMWPSR
ncbi:MAG: sensor histidine kinase [Evtepia gabavorous]